MEPTESPRPSKEVNGEEAAKKKPKHMLNSFFQKGFGTYLESSKYSDLTLFNKDREYKVHRIILSYSSEFFCRLLLGDFKESNLSRIELKFPDPENVFQDVLKFMYSGTINLTTENAIPLLSMADHYLISSLKKAAENFIEKTINRDNALKILERAVGFQAHDIEDKCINCIAKNFCHIKVEKEGASYTILPHWLFRQLLQHPSLAVKDEWLVYQTVCTYISAHKELEPEQITSLIESIRFRWMSVDQLEKAQGNPLVPREMLLEASMIKLKEANGGNENGAPVRLQLQPRMPVGMQFEFGSDFDDKGILYWISTNGGRDIWENPHNSGKIKVSSSSIDRGDTADLVSREPTELWTKDVPASWFMIDLGKMRTVLPVTYSLRHGGNYRADSLRTWDLQGSMDGQTWTVLRRHNIDKSLNSNFATHSWPIIGNAKAFRYFRILQTGRNSNNHNFLVLSGIEFLWLLVR